MGPRRDLFLRGCAKADDGGVVWRATAEMMSDTAIGSLYYTSLFLRCSAAWLSSSAEAEISISSL